MNATKLFLSLISLAFLMTVIGYSDMTVQLTSPLNNTWALTGNNTNTTLPFVFNYTTTVGNASATCQLVINGSNATIANTINNTVTYIYANASFSPINMTWYVNCTNTSRVESTTRQVVNIDVNSPKMTTISALNISNAVNMSIRLDYRVNDSIGNPSNVSCYATVIDSLNRAYVNITGSVNDTNIIGNAASNCTISINASDLSSVPDGLLTINGTIVDMAGNTNITVMLNYTKISLYPGWNMVQAMGNGSLLTVAQMLGEVSHVSIYNNSNHNYTSYVVGLVTNNATKFEEGDVLYVKVPRASTLLWQNVWMTGNNSQKFFNLTAGWNQISAFNKTINFTKVYLLNGSGWADLNNWTTTTDMKAVSWYNASGASYMSSLYPLTINTVVTIQRGMGFWILVNDTTKFYTRRT